MRNLSDAERISWIRLSRAEGIGPVTFFYLIERFGSASNAINELPKFVANSRKSITLPSISDITSEYEKSKKLGMKWIAHCEADYPELLHNIQSAPPIIGIYARNHELLSRPTIAIVGTRNASAAGLHFTNKLANELSNNGFTIVSGMARGIDSAAHRGSMSGGTVAVIAHGIDDCYPEENRNLYEEIKEKGIVVTEHGIGTPIHTSYFARRNRIIAGLAWVVIVVEAGQRSGALITARYAADYGREVAAVPGHPLDPRSRGPNMLIREGAALIESADDIIAIHNQQKFLHASPHRSSISQFGSEDTSIFDLNLDIEIKSSDKDIILGLLGIVPVSIENIVQRSGLPSSQVRAIIAELEIAGHLIHDCSGQVMVKQR